MNTPSRIFSLALLASVGMTLGGCNVGPNNRTLYSVHQPVVQRADYVFDAATDGMGGIAPSEQARIGGWFQALNLGYGDRVSVDDGSGAASPASVEAVATVAGRYGLLVADSAPATSSAIPTGHVRVIVSRSTASVPSCPDWKDQSATDFVGGTHSNYGCATNSNMAAMIANPDDLVRGQSAASDLRTATSTRAIKTYQDKPLTGAGQLERVATGNGGN